MSYEENQSNEIIPFVEFTDNTNERTPCVLVLDCSKSMNGKPIAELNNGLKCFEEELKNDIDASARVQVLVIKAYGLDKAEVASDWVDAMDFEAPFVEADGLTPLGIAMELALEKIEEQKRIYDSYGITSKRPWIFLISDGEPNDLGWENVADRCKKAVENKKALIYTIGTKDANFEKLSKFSTISPKVLDGLKFKEFFLWLSRSVSSISKSSTGQLIQLSPTDEWSVIEV